MLDSQFVALTAKQARQGHRRLLIISGDSTWTETRALSLIDLLPGDWLWVSNDMQERGCPPGALKTLLGREFLHAVFDARHGLDVQALAALAGTLRAGSWLVLLAPAWERWAHLPDADSPRWSDSPQPIPTPLFIERFQHIALQDSRCARWLQGEVPALPDIATFPDWHAASGAPLEQQNAILTALRAMESGVAVVTGPRGRGKSALAGMLAHGAPRAALVTAPTRAAVDILAQYAQGNGIFIAPDRLLTMLDDDCAPAADWLIVDEAAALPLPQLRRLISAFARVLLTTTVQGYEGTGRGFLLKFCAGVSQLRRFSLGAPVRWAENDPLERLLDNILLFDDSLPPLPEEITPVIDEPQSAPWRHEPALAESAWRLLSGAHYRTSPLDLRRMMDVPGQRFIFARHNNAIAGALWLVDEGGLAPELSRAVWAGVRRPRGNLVAQSLAAHGGAPLAATLRGQRVSRIAVHPDLQRRGLGQRLLSRLRQRADGYDYLSVSFGYTGELWRFWKRAGFILVRFGSHREASSGCYAAMALLPLTPAGARLARGEHRRLRRDARWLADWIDEPLPLKYWHDDLTLNRADWRELAGFAYGHRPLEACLGSLQRMLAHCSLPLQALRSRLEQHLLPAEICARYAIAGRRALLAAWREETAQAMRQLAPTCARALEQRLNQLKKR